MWKIATEKLLFTLVWSYLYKIGIMYTDKGKLNYYNHSMEKHC